MAYKGEEPRVAESSTSVGAGDFALAGAITERLRFSAVCAVGDTFDYVIKAADGTWEEGFGTYSAANTLTRTAVKRSSNANAAVVFAAGNKTVFINFAGLSRAISEADQKNPPTGADKLGIWDSVTGLLKGLTLTNLASWFASLAITLTSKTLTTPVINGFSGDSSAINIGSGQIVKDTSGNVGIGEGSPGTFFGNATRLVVSHGVNGTAYVAVYNNNAGASAASTLRRLTTTGNSYWDSGLNDASGAPIAKEYFGSAVVSWGLNMAGADRLSVATSTGHMTPGSDNTQNFGSTILRWATIFAGTGTINTSDAREKTAVAPLADAEIAAAKDMAGELGGFKFLSSIAEKGNAARTHIGMSVQRAIEIMTGHGLDPMAYAFICYDKWDATTKEVVSPTGAFSREVRQQVVNKVAGTVVEIVDGVPVQKACSHDRPTFVMLPVLDEQGRPVTTEVDEVAVPAMHPVPVMETVTERFDVVEVTPAGDRYGFRADELHAFILRGLAAEHDALLARVAALESP
jgi:hypothetical protein